MSQKHYPCINLSDVYTPLAVWKFSWSGWQFVKVVRPTRAIEECKPPLTLVFPVSVKPDELEKQLKSSLQRKKFLRSQRSTVLFKNSDRWQKYPIADLVALASCK